MSAHARASEGNFWDESRERREAAPALAGDIAVDVAVIGAGYTGLATAYHLKCRRAGARCGDPRGRDRRLRRERAQRRLRDDAVWGLRRAHEVAARQGAREGGAHTWSTPLPGSRRRSPSTGSTATTSAAGFLRVATAPSYVPRIQKEIELFHSLGIDDMQWLDAQGHRLARALADVSRRLLGAGLRAAQSGEVGGRAPPSRSARARASTRARALRAFRARAGASGSPPRAEP